jgi:hypothetical protein
MGGTLERVGIALVVGAFEGVVGGCWNVIGLETEFS